MRVLHELNHHLVAQRSNVTLDCGKRLDQLGNIVFGRTYDAIHVPVWVGIVEAIRRHLIAEAVWYAITKE